MGRPWLGTSLLLLGGCDWNGLSSAYDLASPPDLAVESDLAMGDLSTPDLTPLIDLRTPFDLVGFSIAAVTPALGPSNGGIEVHVTGAGFALEVDAGTQPKITFNGVPATNVQWVDATEIKATLPANPNLFGKVVVEVENPDGSKASSNDVFRYYLGSVNFNRLGPYAVGSQPVALAAADFNGDGKIDVASSDSASSGGSILFGVGDGSLKSATPFAVPMTVVLGIAAARINGDAFPDLVVVGNQGTTGAHILLNDTKGGFSKDINYLAGANPHFVAVADLDGKKGLDLLVTNRGGNSVSVLLGVGDGTFSPAVSYPTGAGPAWVATGDFDGNGIADVVTANREGDSLSVILGKGDGTLLTTDTFAIGPGPYGVAVGDLDGDGKADLVVTLELEGSIDILLGDGKGKFGMATKFDPGAVPITALLADVNHDDRLDLVYSSNNGLRIKLGDGKGGLGTPITYVVGGGELASPALADFNGDGKIDVAVGDFAANIVYILRNDSQ